MTYGDKTWCMAACASDGTCGRKLTNEDYKEIKKGEWLISYADYSDTCVKYEPLLEEEE